MRCPVTYSGRALTILGLCLAGRLAAAVADTGTGAAWLSRFQERQELAGFTCHHLYLDSQDRPAGACLVHRSGFTLDLLPMETAPQAFVWIATPVADDRGAPHTLEHLLLGKGRRGLSVANAEEFRLSSSSAFTGQFETCYNFSTALGTGDFLVELEDRLDALMHPDFSDEEIRREVCHVGPKAGPDGLVLEEKGTVYTEMLSSWDNPWSRADHRLHGLCYGAGHPAAVNQGGIPAAIRDLRPADIRAFQAGSHFLANMGAQLVLPAGDMTEPLLARLDAMLGRLEPVRPGLSARKRDSLPPPRPVPRPAVAVVEVPGSRAGEPALILAAWPPRLDLDRGELLAAQILLTVAAQGESSDLYRQLIDEGHARDPLGAAWMSGWIGDGPGHSVQLAFGSVPPSRVTEAAMVQLRDRVAGRLGEIAAWREGEPELAAMKDRALAELASRRRSGRRLLDQSPGFGDRGTGSFLADHLRDLRDTGGYRLRLDDEPFLAEIEARLRTPGNPFAPVLERLGLLTSLPHVVGTRSNPELLAEKEASRAARLEAFADSLETAYGARDRQEALRRFAADYDQVTAQLEAQRAGLPTPSLPEHLPLDDDPEIVTDTLRLANGIPMCHGVFAGMQGARFDLAVDLTGMRPPARGQAWLAVLPALLSQAGVAGAMDTLDFRQVEDALRREVGWAGCWIDTDLETGRAELVFTAVGADGRECVTGIGWLRRFLQESDWRAGNRERLREIVRRDLAGLREVRRGAEESWVEVPAAAWRQRGRDCLWHAGCFLTQEYDLLRCAWALEDVPETLRGVLAGLAEVPGARAAPPDSCLAWLARLLEVPADQRASAWRIELAPQRTRPFSEEELRVLGLAMDDLRTMTAEVPAERFHGAWARVCSAFTQDDRLLQELSGLREDIRDAWARSWFTGSQDSWAVVRAPAEDLSRLFHNQPRDTGPRPGGTDPAPEPDPVCAGLVNPGSTSGVVISSAPLAWQHRWTREDLLSHLAGNLLGGGSDHGLFMQTWAAGLAYSNGIRPRERTGLLRYYAERCPDAAQTLAFAEACVRQSRPTDRDRAHAALVTALNGSRAAADFDERTRLRALELQVQDGAHPGGSIPRHSDTHGRLEDLRRFRRGLIDLRDDPSLPRELESRKLAVHARVFPGLAEGGWRPPPGSQFFLIGPERQFELVDAYLAARAPGQRMLRLHPCDFWRD